MDSTVDSVHSTVNCTFYCILLYLQIRVYSRRFEECTLYSKGLRTKVFCLQSLKINNESLETNPLPNRLNTLFLAISLPSSLRSSLLRCYLPPFSPFIHPFLSLRLIPPSLHLSLSPSPPPALLTSQPADRVKSFPKVRKFNFVERIHYLVLSSVFFLIKHFLQLGH